MIGKPAAAALLALLLGGLLAVQGQAGTDTTSYASYWELLDQARSALRTAPEPAVEPFAELAGRLEAVTAVVLPNGTVVPVDHRYLAGLLRADPPDTELSLSILDEAFRFKNRKGPASFVEADLNTLAAILSGAEYRWPDPAGPSPLAELWQRVLNGFARLLARLLPGARAGTIINTFLLVLIALGLGLILRFVYLNAVRDVIREAEIDPAAGVPAGLTADQAVDRARTHAESGDLREAVRYLYLAALLALETRGHFRLDRAHTNRELLADLSPRPELASRFRAVIETFDRVWYGFQPISLEEYRRYSESVANLKNLSL